LEIKNYKIVKYSISLAVIFNLFFCSTLVFGALTDDLQAEINQKQSQIQELEKEIAEYTKLVQTTKTQGTTLKAEITRMQNQINKLEAEIRLTQTKISQTSLKIQGLASDIQTQGLEIEKQKSALGQTLRIIDEYDQESTFALVLRNANLSDFLSQVQYIESLQGGVQEKLQTIKDLKAQLEAQKTQSESYKTSLEGLKSQLKGQGAVLDNQKDEKDTLLKTTKNQEKAYQSTLTTLQQQRTQIENDIFAAEQKLRALINQSTITAGKGALLRPVSGVQTQTYGCIVTSFARKSYPACNEGRGNGGFHNGIDLDGDTGDPIIAARDGVVSGTGNLGKYSYGKWIAIKHANGLTTLYGHMSAQVAGVGQAVKSGQVIGYIGSTGYSTGSHLHLTVFATDTFTIQQKWYGPVPLGGTLNPLLYL